MICQTIRKGSECAFMTAKGCGYNGGLCHEIITSCQGCGRATQLDSGWYAVMPRTGHQMEKRQLQFGNPYRCCCGGDESQSQSAQGFQKRK